ncbi:NACHT domain-containing protein [Burkholderia sp. PU8-34]
MPIDLPVWLKAGLGWAWPKLKQWGVDRFARACVSRRAMEGGNFASEGSLPYLVKMELERLASDPFALPEIRSASFRSWLRSTSNLELFVSVLVAKAGGGDDVVDAQESLAEKFQEATGETSRLAAGWVNLTISYVHGQLNATEDGRNALQAALGFRNSAQLGRIESLVTPPSTFEVVAKVRQVAAGLLEAGRRSWKMPRSVAPLTLEERESYPSGESHRVTIAEVASAIGDGRNLILFGSGGIGKTTLLLELCGWCSTTGDRIPLFVDAAVWARSNLSVLEYVARSAAAQLNQVTANELADLAKSGNLVIMLNGWNEISALSKLSCREHLLQLGSIAPKLVVVVVSRTASDVPSLDRAKHLEVLGLTWRGQVDVIRGELDGNQADGLLDLLVRDTRLRHAGRSPLILRGLIAQAKEGLVAGSSVFGLLGAAVRAFEGDDQRNLVLSESPVDGHHRVYLEELACDLTQRVLTACSREEALRCMRSAGKRLMERGISGEPNPSAVLAILVSHHLLHFDGDTVRFAHQRFQEYFAATRLVRAFDGDDTLLSTLRPTLNLSAWEESLLLSAGELKSRPTPSEARARLVKVLSEIDLGLACDAAGVCRFSDADDHLRNSLIERINQIASSNLEEVRYLGIAYQLASRFPEFSENLWTLLETDDMQARLHVYRLGGIAMSLSQLGVGAKERVAAWPPERRAEFVHEIASDADNYEFLVQLATAEPDLEVRVAAISALFWRFPASDAALTAWLNAPVEVQVDDRLMSEVGYALEEGIAGDEVRDRIRGLVNDSNSPDKQLRLALFFPEEIDARGVDLVFEELRGSERHANYATCVAVARKKDPGRLESLVQELALAPGLLPQWVREYLAAAPDDVGTGLFAKAWLNWQKDNTSSGTVEQLGFLANQAQIEQIVTQLMSLSGKSRPLSNQDGENRRTLERLLANAAGDDLLAVVMARAEGADYEIACRLVELVYRRTGADTGIGRDGAWLPAAPQIRQLFEAFGEKQENAEIPQNELKVLLCCIASLVVPTEMETLLLDATRSYLDSWLTFREVVEKWSKNPSSPRPQNPYWGTSLGSAWVRTGFSYLQHLLELMEHPEAKEFVPELVSRIVNIPWEAQLERGVFRNITSDIEDGKRRRAMGRVLMQPDDAQQPVTDEAARAIGKMLEDLVSDCMRAKAEDAEWNTKPAAHWVRRLAVALANIPSLLVVRAVSGALTSGLMDVFGTVASIRALVRQGMVISDASVVRAIEVTYDREGQAQWLDDSTRHAMSELTQLVFCVSPATLLSRPLEHYAKQWPRFEHVIQYIRLLSATPPENAWPALLQIGLDPQGSPNLDEQFASALLSAVTIETLPELLALIEDGTLFRWYGNEWSLRHPPPGLARILERAGQVPAFARACHAARSSLSDMLAGRVLAQIGCEDDLSTYLLEAVDAGRAIAPSSPGYRLLKEMFVSRTDIGDGQREISPKAQNELRAALYLRAKGTGDVANGCIRLLAELECERREAGRPEDELRHPMLDDGRAWTEIFGGV